MNIGEYILYSDLITGVMLGILKKDILKNLGHIPAFQNEITHGMIIFFVSLFGFILWPFLLIKIIKKFKNKEL